MNKKGGISLINAKANLDEKNKCLIPMFQENKIIRDFGLNNG
jgi:hypothetical protein